VIVTYFLCAVVLSSLPCLPFTTEEGCATAVNNLDLRIVEQAKCAKVEMLHFIDTPTSPLPPRKP